ncbi:MAG: Ig-like domain-containing protein [Bacteroidales bacterium]|jgi:uncharacterized protein YjdB|nr:Ig-like domain-containing protein [Bacteroidales bacterium]
MMRKIVLVCALLSGIAVATQAQIKINEVSTSNSIYQDAVGDKGDWMELYNSGTVAVNIKGYFLTDNKDKPRKWEFTEDMTIQAGGFAIVWCDGKNGTIKGEPHTSFKLSSDGEPIRLYSNTMLLCDSVTIPLVERNFSYGRTTDGSGDWALLKKTSPKASNNNTGYFKGMAPQPVISLKGGWYSGAQAVTISSTLPGAVIRYTTDGAEPTASSPIYNGEIINAEKKTAVTQKYGYNREDNTGIKNGTGWPANFTYPGDKYKGNRDYNCVIKAKAFHPDYMTSNTAGETYFINERKPTLPVISLSIDKKYLFSADSGLYIQGTNGVEEYYGHSTATKYNWAQDWSYPAHIEFYDANGVKQFANTMTIEVFGNASRSFDLKSLAVKCKNKYENTEINYPIFGSDGLQVYQSFILRNSGNDWGSGNFARDAITQQIVRGQVDLETQDYQPVVVYINGEYWSLMNMRERLAAEYFAGYHDYATDVDLLKINTSARNFSEISEGDDVRYNELIALLGSDAKNGTKADLSTNQELYDNLVNNYVDADNIITYYIAQTYCDNGDWPHNNTRMWRPRVENGKFRFPLYDTDFGYGLWNSYNYSNTRTFDRAFADKETYIDDGTWKNMWSTVIFRSLLTKPEFKAEFLQRYFYMLNTVYSDARMSEIADPIEERIASERDEYTNKEWVRSSYDNTSNMKSWNAGRRGVARERLDKLGGSKGSADYTVQYTASQGKVQLCGLDVENGYKGKQMLAFPIRMTALPADGYQLKHWEDGKGTILSTEREFSYTMTAAATVKAVFESRETLAPATLRVNELMASNDATIATEFGRYTDWFEIYNPGTEPINLAGLYVSNTAANPTLYQIPYGDAAATTVPAQGFLLLWASQDTYSGITHLPFKLSKEGGVVILSQKNASGTVIIIDSLHYGTQNTDISFGRFPNGNKDAITFETPTPKTSNVAGQMPEINNIYITEILAKNASTNLEETGNYADWFELYNDNDEAVDVGGLYVTRDFSDLNMYQIPRGYSEKTTIPAKGYMIMWADKQPAINPNHVDFKLTAEQCQLALVQTRGGVNVIIDSVSFGYSGEDISYGRYPNNNSAFRYLATPTPAAKNVNTAPAKVTGITINEILAVNTSVLKADDGKYYDYVEFYNAGTTPVDLGGLFVSDSIGYPLKYRIQRSNSAATTIQPGEWLTFFASDSASLGTRHFSFALNKDAEDFVLSQVTANGVEQLDYISFSNQAENVSYGRFPETADNWESMEATPTAANISAESSPYLKTITSSIGTITPAVVKDVFEYVCLLPSSVTTVPTISATAIHERATVQITQATTTNGKATILVKSANGLEEAEYSVTFSNDPSGDASLKSLAVNVGTLTPEFASDVYNYTLSFTSSTQPLFTAIATNPNSKVEVLYGANYSNPTIIRVTSENNTEQEYTITYDLNLLEVAQWVDDFSNGIDRVKQVSTQYTLQEKDGALYVHFQRGADDVDGYFEYQLPENVVVNAKKMQDNADGKKFYVSIIAHTVELAEDGTKLSGTTAGVKARIIAYDGYEASNRPYDDGGYSIGLTADTYEFNYSDSQADKSKVSKVRFVFDPANTSSAKNKVIIIEKIVIGPQMDDVVELSNNANLATLTSSLGVISPTFNVNTLEYTVTLPAGTTTIPTIAATKANANATVQISQASSLASEATVTVIAEDLLTTKNYIVHFVAEPLTVDGYTDNILQPALLAWNTTSSAYDLSYSAGVLNIDYARTATSGSPFIEYNVLAGENTILDLTSFPYFSVKLKSTVNTVLRAELYDAAGTAVAAPTQSIAQSTSYGVYTFDFSGLLTTLSASEIYGVKLYFDAGTTTAKLGTITIDDVRFGSDVEIAVNAAPVIATIPAQTVEQTKAFDPIDLNSYVSDDNTAVEDLDWSVSVAENFTVTIDNSNVATITAKDDEWIGSERVTFTVADEHGATATRSVTFTVTELVIPIESLSFSNENVSLLLGAEQSIATEVIVNPDNATDKTLTYTSSNPLVVSIDATGTMTALQEGRVIITVTSTNEKTTQCEVEVVPIRAEEVTVIPASMTLLEDEIATLTVEISPENTTHKEITWESLNTNVVAILSGNRVQAKAEGTATIVATVDGISAECHITVEAVVVLVDSITLPSSMDLEVNETAQLSAQFYPEDAEIQTLTWSSSAPSVVGVSSDGKITALAVGTALITAETVNNKTATTTVTVKGIEPESITLSETALTLTEGETATLVAKILPADVTNTAITWKSSNTTVATVLNGVITAESEGRAEITATTHNGKTIACELTVKPVLAESVTLSGTHIILAVGETAQASATIQPENTTDKTLTWQIAAGAIAQVDESGIITALAEGTTTLTVSTANGKTSSCTVEVVEIDVPVEEIKIVEGDVNIEIDEIFDFTVEFAPAEPSNKTVLWTSSNPAIASIVDGAVTALRAGTVEIRATTPNGKIATVTLTVNAIPAESIALSETEITLYDGQTATLTAEILPAKTSDKTIDWSSILTEIAVVDNGIITARSVGETTIMATTHNGITAECKVTVLPVDAKQIFLPYSLITIPVGGEETMQVTFDPENTSDKTITWTIADETIARIENGVLQGLAAGTTTLTATSSNGKTAICEITVSEIVVPVESISLPAVAIAVDIDETAELTVTFAPKNATNKTLSWTSSDNAIVRVSSGGVITGISAGIAEVIARSANNKADTILVTVNPMLASSITLSETALTLEHGQTATLTAKILPEKTTTKTITWESSDETIATVVDGEITTLAVGTTTITATTTNGKFAECVLTVTPVMAQSLTLSSDILSLGIGDAKNLQATVLPLNTADKSLTWSIDKSAIATIDQNGLVTAQAEGTATVTVTTANGQTAQCAIEVVAVTVPVSTVTLYDSRNMPITSLTLPVDDEYQLTAEVMPTDATDKTITWTSKNPSIASIVNGKITALLDGQTEIMAVSTNGKTARVNVIVLPLDVEEIRLTPQTAETFVGETVSIISEVLPAKAKAKTLLWSSSDEDIATVDESGVVTALAVGSVSITARSESNPTIAKTATIQVKPLLPTSVNITSGAALSVLIDESLQLTYSVFPVKAENSLTWQSRNESILTVNSQGLVTAVAVGTTWVVAHTANGLTDSIKITVNPILISSFIISPSSITLAIGKKSTVPIEVTVLPEKATDKSYTYKMLDESIATIDAQGFITAHAEGRTRLEYSADNSSAIGYCLITVNPENEVQSIALEGGDEISISPDAIVYQLTPTFEPENAAPELTWTVADETIVSVSQAGVLTPHNPGTTTVTVCTDNGKCATKIITVRERLPLDVVIVGEGVNAGILEMTIGQTVALSALIEPENAHNKEVTWSVSSNKLSISEDGLLTANAEGSLLIVRVATVANNQTAELWVTVKEVPIVAVENIEFTNPGVIYLNETKQIEFTTTPLDADRSTIEWSSSDETVATVDENGVIHTSDKEGSVIITARFANGNEQSFTVRVSEYLEPIATQPITVTPIYQGDMEFNPIDLKNYFTADKGRQLLYSAVNPSGSKLSVMWGGVEGNICSVTVTDPDWSGSETLIMKATYGEGLPEATIEVVFTVLPKIVGITSVDEAMSTINAYPTVTSTYTTLTISSAEPAEYTLSLYDIEGKLIESHRLFVAETLQKIISFENRPTGIYTCVVAGNNEKHSVKIVVE